MAAARKKRILVCGELSILSTGYAIMAKAIIDYLVSTNKYEVAEMANYCMPMDMMAQRDPRNYQLIQQCRHIIYPVMPYEDEQNIYNSNPMNQFGAWRYEDVLLNFRPDFVISWLDIWMSLHLLRSPFRKFYKLLLMPAIDGTPQDEDWVQSYKQADKLITYTDWAGKVLAELGIDSTTNSPGVDLHTYFPSHKKVNYNNNADMLVVGTVMRNQKRKLYPNLINSFSAFLKYCRDKGNNKLADNTYLYIHSTYPDLGWDFCRLIKDSDCSNRILFSYICKNCGTVFPSLFSDSRTNCVNCHKFAASFPSTQYGIPSAILANIYNTFDCYLQVSTNEGFGIPLIESAACGVHAFATDYSAMSDVIRKIKGDPIRVDNYFKESETGRDFALPSQEHFVEELYKFLTLPEGIRRKKGFDARKAAEKYFSWNRSCKEWERIIDEQSIEDDSMTWNSNPRLVNSDTSFLNNPAIKNLSPSEFVRLSIDKIAGNILNHEQFRVYQWLKQVNYGMSLQMVAGSTAFNDLSFLGMKQNLTEYGGKQLVEELVGVANNWNKWEKVRCGLENYNRPKFLNAIYNGK